MSLSWQVLLTICKRALGIRLSCQNVANLTIKANVNVCDTLKCTNKTKYQKRVKYEEITKRCFVLARSTLKIASVLHIHCRLCRLVQRQRFCNRWITETASVFGKLAYAGDNINVLRISIHVYYYIYRILLFHRNDYQKVPF